MNKLQEFDELVENGVNDPDGWSDYFKGVAEDMAMEFTATEWEYVDQLWKTRREGWQINFAGILGSFNAAVTVPILENMVQECSQPVASQALNSLEGIDGSEDGFIYVPGKEILQKIEEVSANEISPFRKNTFQSLKERAINNEQ